MESQDWYYHVQNDFSDFPVEHLGALSDFQLEYFEGRSRIRNQALAAAKTKALQKQAANSNCLMSWVPSEGFLGYMVGVSLATIAIYGGMILGAWNIMDFNDEPAEMQMVKTSFAKWEVPAGTAGQVLTADGWATPQLAEISCDSIAPSDLADGTISSDLVFQDMWNRMDLVDLWKPGVGRTIYDGGCGDTVWMSIGDGCEVTYLTIPNPQLDNIKAVDCIAGIMGFPKINHHAIMGGESQYKQFMSRFQCRVNNSLYF